MSSGRERSLFEAEFSADRKALISQILYQHLTSPEKIAADLNTSEWIKEKVGDDYSVTRTISPEEAQIILSDFEEQTYKSINAGHALSSDIKNIIVKNSLQDVHAIRGQIRVFDHTNDIDVEKTKPLTNAEKDFAAKEYDRLARTLIPDNALSLIDHIEKYQRSLQISEELKQHILTKLLLVRNENHVLGIYKQFQNAFFDDGNLKNIYDRLFYSTFTNQQILDGANHFAKTRLTNPEDKPIKSLIYTELLKRISRWEIPPKCKPSILIEINMNDPYTNSKRYETISRKMRNVAIRDIDALQKTINLVIKLDSSILEPAGITTMLKIIKKHNLTPEEKWHALISSAHYKSTHLAHHRTPILQDFYLRVAQLGRNRKKNPIDENSLKFAFKKINHFNPLLQLKHTEIGLYITEVATRTHLTIDAKLHRIQRTAKKVYDQVNLELQTLDSDSPEVTERLREEKRKLVEEKALCFDIIRYIDDLNNPEIPVNISDYPALINALETQPSPERLTSSSSPGSSR